MEKDEIRRNFSKGLCNFAKRKCYTHEEIAEKIGCSTSNISHLKSGKTIPHLGLIYNLLDNGMTLDEVFGPDLAAKLLAETARKRPQGDDSPDEKAAYVMAGFEGLLSMMDGKAKVEK